MALSERDRRTVTIGGASSVVLLAGFVLFSVLGGGEEAFPPIPDTPLPTSSPSPPPDGGPPIQSFTGRDPSPSRPVCRPRRPSRFRGLGWRSGAEREPEREPIRRAVGTPSPTAPGNDSSQTVGGSTVVLLDIFERDGATRAQVEVDGTVFDVGMISSRGAGSSCDRSGELCHVPVRRRVVHALHHAPEIAPATRPRGSGRRRGGGARAAPPHFVVSGPAMGPIRCSRAQAAHRR